eukprot:3763222-Prymnesium_polylepis.1
MAAAAGTPCARASVREFLSEGLGNDERGNRTPRHAASKAGWAVDGARVWLFAHRDAAEGVVLSERLLLQLDLLGRPRAQPLRERRLAAAQPARVEHVELDHLGRQLGRVEESLAQRARRLEARLDGRRVVVRAVEATRQAAAARVARRVARVATVGHAVQAGTQVAREAAEAAEHPLQRVR